MESATVGDIMTSSPVSVGPDANVYDAAHTILVNKISGVAVCSDSGELLGMVSELDCLRAIVTSVYNGADPGGALVQDIMTANVETNSPEEDIFAVARSMLDNKRRRRPVVENGKMTGELSCRQILNAVTDMIDEKA